MHFNLSAVSAHLERFTVNAHEASSSCPDSSMMDLSPAPGLAHMARGVQQVSGNPPWRRCLCVRAPGTDGARLGWDPGQDRVPAMNSRWFTLRLRTEGWGAGGSFCAADLCWLQGQPSERRRRGRRWGGYDKWVSEKGWFGHPRGLASSSGPLVSCRICAACV